MLKFSRFCTQTAEFLPKFSSFLVMSHILIPRFFYQKRWAHVE